MEEKDKKITANFYTPPIKFNKEYYIIKEDSISKRKISTFFTDMGQLCNDTGVGIYRREQTKEYQDFMKEKHEMPSEIIKNQIKNKKIRLFCKQCNKVFTASYIELQNPFGYDSFFVCPVCKSFLEKM
ncbi:hypothetical protein R4Q14_03165 [Brachyspira intermedia]|uniref:hypothetical protein n=1 Tax=Brachyspira intermedia TaxID=84377 RepID=UPI003003F382